VSADRVLTMLGAIAIPIGHPVECFVLSRDLGVFQKDVQPVPSEPLVRDLQTGVYYGRHWHFSPGPGAATGTPRTSDPAEGVGVVERFTGRVKACLVSTDGVTQHQHAETTLVIDTGPVLT
jgi:hypothetical protein